jgi:hypothetical protein
LYNWKLRWNFDSESYQPDSIGQLSFNLENTREELIFVSDVGIKFDWMKQKFFHFKLDKNEGKLVRPKQARFITNLSFKIPQNVSGQRFYTIYFHGYGYNKKSRTWEDLGKKLYKNRYCINVISKPCYNVFITRSLAIEDRIIGDEIVSIIKEWGFIPKTVVFNERVSDQMLRETIRTEILSSNCLIAIATPRYLDALSRLWKTFPWLHNEVGIAFGNDFPILILVDNRIEINGLPSILKEYLVHFDINDYNKTRNLISEIMPAFRTWLSNKKWDDYKKIIKKVGLGVGLITLGGIAGYLASKYNKEG